MNKFSALITGRPAEEVETRPIAPPEWQPAGGDLISHPGQQVERVINRIVRVDGNVTVFEQEIVFAPEPQLEPAGTAPAVPEPEREDLIVLERRWKYAYEGGAYFEDTEGNPLGGLGIDEIYRAAHEGRLILINTLPGHPLLPHEAELWNIARRGRQRRLGLDNKVKTNNGRIVLQE